MEAGLFINYYEIFDVDPNAPREVIERKFRELALRYHPDNLSSGDRTRFDAVVEAHETLKDHARRAQYHEQHKHHLPPYSHPPSGDQVETEAEATEGLREQEGFFDELGVGRDIAVQNNILLLMYHRRRLSVREPGIGSTELEMLTGCSRDHLDFHIWYLKAKGWIGVEETGLFAITIDGVDRAAAIYRDGANKRIADQT